jgi:hypothetical protein
MRPKTRPQVGPGRAIAVLALLAAFIPATLQAQDTGYLARALEGLRFREIGPAVMGGRVADLAVNEANPAEFYVGFASGGVWKTTNQGMSWTPIFDRESTASIGDVTLAPSNPNILWVGTGEPQNRQSSPWGDGVYKSVDGGRTWRHVGLRETRHIGRIIIHPTNPEIVWVAAVGHLWGPNEERGVFRTKDGGATWEKVLYIDENTGAIDLAIDPGDPNTLYAAMYQRRRTPWGFSASGPGSGLYRTLDGGDTWTELTNGLPKGDKGRIGIDVYRRDGNLVYAIVESDREGRGLYRSRDRGESWEKVSSMNPRPMYFSMVRIDPNDPERIYLGGVELQVSDDGGKTWREGDGAKGIHVDHHALWIDPNDSRHLILGNDGGVASSFDRGETWRHHNNLAVGQFYEIGVDMRDPYYVCGGLQDNSSWCGPIHSLNTYGIRNSDWYDVSGGDGFYNRIDPTDPRIVYTESQNGNLSRVDVATGEAARIRPIARPTPDDSARNYRFNWNTPIHISWHDPATIYIGANHLLRSRDRGAKWEEASPDLTRRIDRDTLPIMGMKVDSTTLSRHDGVSAYGTITVIGESPIEPGVLYVGTDDGMLHVTRDGGATWTDITGNVPGLVHGMLVSGIEPSRHVPGRVYLAFDGHQIDDYRPYVFVSEDYGRKWKRITEGLPAWSVNVVREHPRTADLLFVGNEIGAYASFDRGGRWHRLTGNLPTVPVDDIVIHPRENDLILATHGRSIWVLDDASPLEALTRRETLTAAATLFPVRRATAWALAGAWPFWGDAYAAPNPPDGAILRYWIGEAPAAPAIAAAGNGGVRATAAKASPAEARRKAAKDDEPKVRLSILDAAGTVVRTIEAPGTVGLHEVVWDLRLDPPYEPEPGAGQGGGPPRAPRVLPGTYTVRLETDAVTRETSVEVRHDPRIPVDRETLAARQRALLDLYALARPLYEAGRAATKADERIQAARKLLDAAEGNDALRAQADTLGRRLGEVRRKLAEAGRAGRLAAAIEGVSARPTDDQLWQIDEAWRIGPEAIRSLNEILTASLPALEAAIYRDAARPKPIEPVAVPGRSVT